MTRPRDIEPLLDLWLAEGPTEVPDRVLVVAVDRIERQRQRPAWRLHWRTVQMNRTLTAAAALAAVIVIALVGLRLIEVDNASVGGPPSGSASAPAGPSSSAAPALRACDLISTIEVGTALGLTSTVTASLGDINLGELDYCSYRSAGIEVLGLSYRSHGGGPVFDVWRRGSGVVAVPGLGDNAVWDPTQTTLFILTGDSFVSITGGEKQTPITLDAAKAVGSIVAGNAAVGGPPVGATASPATQPPSAAAIPKACDLASPAEVGAALNLSSAVTSGPASGSNGDVDYCIYRAAGAEVLGVTYRNNGGGAVFDVWNRAAGVQAVPSLGDKAIWDPAQAMLHVLKGDRLLSIEGGAGSPPLGLEAAKAVGSIEAGRM